MTDTPPAAPQPSSAPERAIPVQRNGTARRPAGVLRELEVLQARCMPIVRDAGREDLTIGSTEFVDDLWQFSEALIDFGCTISPRSKLADALASPIDAFIEGDDGEDVTLQQLVIMLMPRIMVRVFSQAQHYAAAVGRTAESAQLALLSDTALRGGIAVGWIARALTAWNSERAGLSHTEIAAKLRLGVDDVPKWIADAKDFIERWRTAPPPEPNWGHHGDPTTDAARITNSRIWMNHRAAPAQLRTTMVRDLVAAGHATNPAVQAALATVPRHQFLPDVPFADAYDFRQAPPTGPRPSSSIAPLTAAAMLDQLDIRPGNTVLQIGTGTGYTAALAAEMARTRRVVTVDRDPEVAARARRTLLALGYSRVEVVTGEGKDGFPGVYDRIIVTASAYDLPDVWVRQLTPEGRIVVPLRLRGTSRSYAFQARGGVVQSRDSRPCDLPRMLGANHDLQRTSAIGPSGRLTLTYDGDQAELVIGYRLDTPSSYTNVYEAWSGVITDHNEPLDSLWLRLAATERGTCGLAASGGVPGLPPLANPGGTPAIVGYGNIAYLIRREIPAGPDGARRYELGAAAYGEFPARQGAAYLDQVRAWGPNRKIHPTLTAFPADTPDERLPPGQHIRRPNQCLVLSIGS